VTLNSGQAKMAGLMHESEVEAGVVSLCKALGLLRYHTYRSTRSPAGFPDEVVVGPNGMIYRELKSQTGKVSGEQQKWLDGLRAAGQDVGVWRPEHLLDGTIAATLKALSGRR